MIRTNRFRGSETLKTFRCSGVTEKAISKVKIIILIPLFCPSDLTLCLIPRVRQADVYETSLLC